MSNADDIRAILLRTADRWDQTEALVKEAENLTGDAVGASMFELRYAGRRLVDAIREIYSPEPDILSIQRFVQAVEENCDRAHHDAIDAIVFYLRRTIKLNEDVFGADLLAEFWPNYIATKRELDEVGVIVVKSRRDRTDRLEVYDRMHQVTIPSIIARINELTQSEDALKKIAQRRQEEDAARIEAADVARQSLETSRRSLEATRKSLNATIVGIIVAAVLSLWGIFFAWRSVTDTKSPEPAAVNTSSKPVNPAPAPPNKNR